jgi:hypothetical protein
MRTRSIRILVCLLTLTAAPSIARAQLGGNVVTDWATMVQSSIHNPVSPRSAGTSQILHTMVVLAMYDAAVAIEGGYEPYTSTIQAPLGADIRAAVATAAYLTARARVAPAEVAGLDQKYTTYMAALTDGSAKAGGIQVGQAAAAALLARRANDGFANVVAYVCSAVPPAVGEFVPDTGCPASPTAPQPVDAKVGFIQPFVIRDATRLRPGGPDPLTSGAYAEDFVETRDYGRIDSPLRTADQTDVAYFWSEHPYVHWNRNLVSLAAARGLGVVEAARFFAMVHTSASDAVIAGFSAKYSYRAWRPRTAIPLADLDGNPDTDPDPSWRPLLNVNHPEYPSGHGFWSSAVLDAVGAFFGTNQVTWTITTSKTAVPALVRTDRTYQGLVPLLREIGDARVWSVLHWRQAILDGMKIGRRVAAQVAKHYFHPVP